MEGTPAGRPSDLHETVVENLFDGVYYVDRKRRITYWNPAAERISGYAREEVVGRSCFDNILGHVTDDGVQLCHEGCPLVQSMAQRRGVEADVFLHHRDGHRVPVHVRCQPVREPDGTIIGAVEIFNDGSSQREAIDRIHQLERLSSTDPLTGVANRRTAELSLRSRLADFREAGWPLGVLFVDIDEFKSFNDTHGHETGDAIIRTVGRSIAAALRESDVVCRWGGDEFLIISAAADRAQMEQIGARVRTLVAASDTTIDGIRLGVTVSVGATLARGEDSVATLVERADRAMYASKHEGNGRFSFEAVDVTPRAEHL